MGDGRKLMVVVRLGFGFLVDDDGVITYSYVFDRYGVCAPLRRATPHHPSDLGRSSKEERGKSNSLKNPKSNNGASLSASVFPLLTNNLLATN